MLYGTNIVISLIFLSSPPLSHDLTSLCVIDDHCLKPSPTHHPTDQPTVSPTVLCAFYELVGSNYAGKYHLSSDILDTGDREGVWLAKELNTELRYFQGDEAKEAQWVLRALRGREDEPLFSGYGDRVPPIFHTWVDFEGRNSVFIELRCSDTNFPSLQPTEQPSKNPTEQPSPEPSEQPTETPTREPTTQRG